MHDELILGTQSQPGLGGREIGFPQGRLLGGSSALNGMAFSATSKANVDAWESLGNPGWDWPSFSQSLARSFTLQHDDGSGETTGAGGPLQLSLPEEDTEWPRVWRETLASLGFATAGPGEVFGGKVLGALVVPDSIQPLSKTRSYAGSAYLEPARSRPNLTVWTKTHVDRVTFDSSDATAAPTATGAQVTRDGKTVQVAASKEVIVTAGAINTPRILELSGVGDAKRLKELGIDVVVDNPNVGENLQNHPLVTLSFEIRDEPGFDTIDKLARQDANALAAAMAAYGNQKSPLSRSGANLVAQLPTPEAESEQLTTLLTSEDGFAKSHESFVRSVLSSSTEATGVYIAIPGFAASTPDGWMAPTPPGEDSYFTLSILLAHPLSRGSVHITSPSSDPSFLAIDPKYFDHPLDLEVMARHVQFAEKIAASEPLASIIKPSGKRNPTAPPSFSDLDVAKTYLRDTAMGAHHFTGTCSMLPRELGGVVDANLRLYGVQNLRVCDASIIPLTPRTNPQATVYGVAEHAAQIIKSGQ
jgi:choline dehydrogenase-like flavoprotein